MATYTASLNAANGTNIGNYTADSGQTHSTNGSGLFHNNRLYWEDSTTKFSQVESFTSDSEYTLTLNARCITDANYIGMFASATVFTDTPFQGYLIRCAPSRTIELYKYTGGGAALLGSYVHGVANATDLAPIKLKASATQLIVEYNGSDVITTSDTSYRAGNLYYWGFGDGATTTGYHLDSVSYVQGVPSVVPPVIDTPAYTNVTATNIDVTFNTDDPTGTAYVLLSANKNETDDQHIKDSATHSQAVSGSGAQTVSIADTDGLKDGLIGYAHIVHENANGLSNIISTTLFTIPSLSNTYDSGSYGLSLTATAPDSSTDSDTGTLLVNPVVPAGTLTLTGQAPEPKLFKIVKPGEGAITLAGQTPNLTRINRITIPTGTLTQTGQAPTVQTTITTTIEPPAGALTLTGYAPTPVEGISTVIEPPEGTLTLTGQVPAFTIYPAGDVVINADVGTLSFTGLTPRVITSLQNPARHRMTIATEDRKMVVK